LVLRSIKVKYKQTFLGPIWALVRPITQILILSVFFGKVLGVPSNGVPYPLFVLGGLLPWILFVSIISQSTESVVGFSNIIKKVFFPRFIIPMSTLGPALIEFFLANVLLVGLMVYYRFSPGREIILIPFLVFLTVISAIGIGMFLAAWNVFFRDFRFMVPLLLQGWMFLTPIIYPLSIIPKSWQKWFYFNPMTGIVQNYKAALVNQPYDIFGLMVSTFLCFGLFLCGFIFFIRSEHKFVDAL
jgi:lipopolysaccharide transport system permease protein